MAEKSLIVQFLFKIGRRICQSDWYIFSNYLLFDKIPGQFFMTVKFGSYSDFKALHKALADSEKHFDDDVVQILKRHGHEIGFEAGYPNPYVDLWEVSGTKLGFTRPVPRSEIYKRAFRFGFKKCSWETIALSRLKCEDKEWRVGGTDPVIYFGNDPFFYGNHLLPLMFSLWVIVSGLTRTLWIPTPCGVLTVSWSSLGLDASKTLSLSKNRASCCISHEAL